jgi:hypothetical protein
VRGSVAFDRPGSAMDLLVLTQTLLQSGTATQSFNRVSRQWINLSARRLSLST